MNLFSLMAYLGFACYFSSRVSLWLVIMCFIYEASIHGRVEFYVCIIVILADMLGLY